MSSPSIRSSERSRARLTRSQLRSVLALAEAMLPGAPNVPAADEYTVDRAIDLVAHVSPQLVTGWAMLQQALDYGAVAQTGRAFHALDGGQQQRLLQSWFRNPVTRAPLGVLSVIYKLAHFDSQPTYERMGGRLKVVTNLEQPRWLSQIVSAHEQEDLELECEVVVVGTGAGGAVVGRELADRGYAVLFVEEGKHYRRDAFEGSAIRAHSTFYRNYVSIGVPPVAFVAGRLVGGSTAINTGTSIRTPSWVLEEWCDKLDTQDFSPEQMEQYFDRVENVLGVQPPDPRYIGPIGGVFERGCRALGWKTGPTLRNATGCEGAGFCDFGCPTDARRSTNLSYLPPALEKGALCLTELRADRVWIENGRAVGVYCEDTTGRTFRIRARAVVLAGGAVPTPLFLMKQGIGNRSGQVGRNLTLHPSAGLAAQFEERIDAHKYIPSPYMSDHFLRDGFLIIAAQPDVNVAAQVFQHVGRELMDRVSAMNHMASFGILIRDEVSRGRIWREAKGQPVITYNLAKQDAEKLHKGLIATGEMCWEAGAQRMFPALSGYGAIESRAEFERFRRAKVNPADIWVIAYHPLGTCKMGRDPATSVVDLQHQVHDVPNLYIVDGSTVPSSLGVNPQITIMAMATRAAGKIADALG